MLKNRLNRIEKAENRKNRPNNSSAYIHTIVSYNSYNSSAYFVGSISQLPLKIIKDTFPWFTNDGIHFVAYVSLFTQKKFAVRNCSMLLLLVINWQFDMEFGLC